MEESKAKRVDRRIVGVRIYLGDPNPKTDPDFKLNLKAPKINTPSNQEILRRQAHNFLARKGVEWQVSILFEFD